MLTKVAARLVAASIAAVLAGVSASGEQAQHGQTTHHSPLPQVSVAGQSDWPLHSLDVKGSRYAALDEIDTTNVERLELAWSFESGAGPGIAQVTPLVVAGVMYLNAGSTLFAVNAASGESIWTLTLDDTLVARGRGPAYGDGRVYAFGDATMYAADGRTGELVESFGDAGRLDIISEALQFQYPDAYPPGFDAATLGYQLTTPPVYFDDTLYAGVALSENHIPGGLVIAADAATGAIKWVFNTVPQGPRDDGWEIAKDTWGYGQKVGGGIWTPPAIDPDLGLLYVNAGNPSPDYDGSARLGMNLFTNATVALHLETGKLAWYYQTIHHDLWDWDHVTGPLLFDVTRDGQTIKGVAAAGKNCLMYIWDRATGEPLNPMVETAVPTETDVPGDEVWPTQPIPYTARGVPMEPFCATYPIVEDPALADRARPMYTPFLVSEMIIGTRGGSNWGPPSFSPRTGLLYVTGKNAAISFTVKPVGDTLEPNQRYAGHFGNMEETADPGVTRTKTLSAYDPVTGEMAWQQMLPTIRPTGTIGNLVTAGDLVFQGSGAGGFYAFDARSGEQLFLHETQRPVSASPLTYRVNGKQYVSVVSIDTVLTFALR